MNGKRSWAVISVEEGDCVLLGTAPNNKRKASSWAFEPDEARLIARHLLQAADVCEGKPMPRGHITFEQDAPEEQVA